MVLGLFFCTLFSYYDVKTGDRGGGPQVFGDSMVHEEVDKQHCLIEAVPGYGQGSETGQPPPPPPLTPIKPETASHGLVHQHHHQSMAATPGSTSPDGVNTTHTNGNRAFIKEGSTHLLARVR
uniref:(California timema) hypothetical protein n=1 Tax=Timema californicum TaxID=61474 RepID=A0A7R9JD12_TIMCA|nr:unnamed protein product [Timema californicum]